MSLSPKRAVHCPAYPMLVAAILLTISVGPHAAVRAQTPVLPPFTGSSQLTYTVADLAPRAADALVNRYRIVSTWFFADPSHWRLDSHTQEPLLQQHDETVAAEGTSLIWYKSIFRRAWSMPLTARPTLGALGMFQGGSIVSLIESMGRSYLAALGQHGEHHRFLGQETIAGRVADVFDIWPLYPNGPQSYGRERLWLDHQYPIVLRLELHGLRRDNGDPQGWVYRVTSLTFGQGPSPRSLAYRPPVAPVPPPTASSSSSSGSAGPHTRWQVPKGFIPVRTPAGYTLIGSSQAQDPMWNGPSTIEAKFTGPAGFLYVEEQIRAGGLPAGLKAGPVRRAGRCRVWIGKDSPSRLSWLALRQGPVSLLAVSDGMSGPHLVRFAAARICP